MDLSEIKHIATLGRLKLSDQEARHYAEKLAQVLSYVSRIESIQTDKILPMSHPIPITLTVQNLRPDQAISPTKPQQLQSILEIAPETQDGFFLVPAVLE